MKIEKLTEMGTYEMQNHDWKDIRDEKVYHLISLARIDDYGPKKIISLSATGEDTKTRTEKPFGLIDFIENLEPI